MSNKSKPQLPTQSQPSQKPQAPAGQSPAVVPQKPPPPNNITIKASHGGIERFTPPIKAVPTSPPEKAD